MRKTIGQVTIVGDAAEIEALKPFIHTVDDVLGHRISDPLELITQPRDEMKIAGTTETGRIIRAEGYWSSRTREISIATDLFVAGKETLLDKTVGHEFIHVLQSDWFTRWHRRQLILVLDPQPDAWNDMTIGDTYLGYIADPTECLATWGSAAVFGWDKPAYSTLYKRRIAPTNFSKTKAVILATAP